MNYQPETVKGFPEFLPPESQKFEQIKDIIKNSFNNYGFLPIKTPSVEFDELMRSSNPADEDEAVSDRFKFQDRGNRNLGLRYEFTFQLARVFKQNPNIKLPLRRYQIGSVFRDEPTSSSRFREFTQADADIIGDSSIEADTECIALASNVCKSLGIESEIHINNRKLIDSILESVKIENKKAVMRELDKLDKTGEDSVKTSLKKYADSNQILTLFKLLEKNLDFFVKNLFEGADEILKVSNYGKAYGFKTKFNPFLVRGLSYYTGNVFELKIPNTKNSIAGGGRYDRVVGKYLNREIPAVGISFGIERLMDLANIPIKKIKAIVISIDSAKQSIALAENLRKENISSIVSHEKVGKSMEYANAYEIKYAIFVGPDEIKKKKFKLKDLESGTEQELTEKQILLKLKD